MTEVHSFFLPDSQFISDLSGLIGYLGEKVGTGRCCLYCNDAGHYFDSVKAVQSHMRDKSHCKLRTEAPEDFDEYLPFYNFNRKSSVAQPLPSSPSATAEGEDDWEDVESDEESKQQPAGSQKTTTPSPPPPPSPEQNDAPPSVRPRAQRPVLSSDGFHFALPNGKLLGHRSLARFYRQRFTLSEEEFAERYSNPILQIV